MRKDRAMGMNEEYKLRLSGFKIKYKKGMESKEYKWIDRIILFFDILLFLLYLVRYNKFLYNEILFFFLFARLTGGAIKIKIMNIMKKNINLKKEIYIKSKDKNLYFYNMEEQTEKLKFQYRNNDFLYRRKIFGGGILIIDGTIKEYYFHIAKKSDYNIFYDDLEKNYIEIMKFWSLKNISRILFIILILVIFLFLIKYKF